MQFARGQKSKLEALTPATDLTVGLGVKAPASPVFDISCFGVDENNQLTDDRYFVFYNQKESPEGALALLGPQDGDREAFRVDLARLPSTIRKLVFTITLDGPGTMSQVSRGHLRITAGGTEVARFGFAGSDFGQEKAIIAGEIYHKDVWRFAAVGQGFNGGLSALLEHFGGEEVEEDSPAQATATPPPAAPDLSKRVLLDKKLEREAPQLLSLAKKAQVSLEKANLADHRAKVALCLDISGSMSSLYRSGKIQRFAEKVLALGTRFDDDGSIDIFLFGRDAHVVGEMTVDNFAGFVGQTLGRYPLEAGTHYGKAIREIRAFYFPDGRGKERRSAVASELPVYVMFLTDGQTHDEETTRQQLVWAAYEPIFWQFMGIGKSSKDAGARKRRGFFSGLFSSDFTFLEQLDVLEGRYVDNASFFSVEDPESVRDDELYDLLMGEYPSWARGAPSRGLIR